MESPEKEKAALISGIEADARTEEQQIIKEAENQAAEKRKYTEKKIESLLGDADKEAREQAEAVKKKIMSSVQLELKRRSMSIRNTVIRDIMDSVEKKLGSMSGDKSYRSILINWITEGAIGLDAKSARINASEKELVFIDEQLISEVTEKIRTKTGRQITLRLSEALPLKSQGVVLTASNGRTAFNNQVKTRMLRKEREIRMEIYNTLFTDDRKEQ
jgi:vacuolar-type H+-ATPase subunit E/Vma4